MRKCDGFGTQSDLVYKDKHYIHSLSGWQTITGKDTIIQIWDTNTRTYIKHTYTCKHTYILMHIFIFPQPLIPESTHFSA